MSLQSYSFVIPAYNEAQRISATLDAIASFSTCQTMNCEIIVIDDGSTDGTAGIAKAYCARHCHMSVHSFPHRGKGFAIRQGVMAAHGDIVVLCDADLAESIIEALPLIEALGHGVDMAIGSRWQNSTSDNCRQPLFRRVSSRIFNMVAGHVLALPFKDTQCGLKTLTRAAASEIFPLLSLDGWGYDLELIHVALTRGLRIEEVGLQLAHDYRDSHFRPIRDGWTACLELLKIRWKDLSGAYGSCTLTRTLLHGTTGRGVRALFSPRLQARANINPGMAERRVDLSPQCPDHFADAQAVEMSCLPSRDDVAA